MLPTLGVVLCRLSKEPPPPPKPTLKQQQHKQGKKQQQHHHQEHQHHQNGQEPELPNAGRREKEPAKDDTQVRRLTGWRTGSAICCAARHWLLYRRAQTVHWHDTYRRATLHSCCVVVHPQNADAGLPYVRHRCAHCQLASSGQQQRPSWELGCSSMMTWKCRQVASRWCR